MSNQQNDILFDKFSEEFDEQFTDNWDLRNFLAEKLLESWEFYAFCKDDAQDYLDNMENGICEELFSYFLTLDYPNFDMLSLAKRVYREEIREATLAGMEA